MKRYISFAYNPDADEHKYVALVSDENHENVLTVGARTQYSLYRALLRYDWKEWLFQDRNPTYMSQEQFFIKAEDEVQFERYVYDECTLNAESCNGV